MRCGPVGQQLDRQGARRLARVPSRRTHSRCTHTDTHTNTRLQKCTRTYARVSPAAPHLLLAPVHERHLVLGLHRVALLLQLGLLLRSQVYTYEAAKAPGSGVRGRFSRAARGRGVSEQRRCSGGRVAGGRRWTRPAAALFHAHRRTGPRARTSLVMAFFLSRSSMHLQMVVQPASLTRVQVAPPSAPLPKPAGRPPPGNTPPQPRNASAPVVDGREVALVERLDDVAGAQHLLEALPEVLDKPGGGAWGVCIIL